MMTSANEKSNSPSFETELNFTHAPVKIKVNLAPAVLKGGNGAMCQKLDSARETGLLIRKSNSSTRAASVKSLGHSSIKQKKSNALTTNAVSGTQHAMKVWDSTSLKRPRTHLRSWPRGCITWRCWSDRHTLKTQIKMATDRSCRNDVCNDLTPVTSQYVPIEGERGPKRHATAPKSQ